MVFQDLIGILVEKLVDGDKLTGFNELVCQYRIGRYGHEVWQFLARGDGQLKLLSVLIVVGRMPGIFMLHTQRFEHPPIVHVVFVAWVQPQ